MSKDRKGGVGIGRRKFLTISYANDDDDDDDVLMANNAQRQKNMIKRFERYIKKKGLELEMCKSLR